MKNSKPELIIYRKADTSLNRVVIPVKYIKKYGRRFKMEVYDGTIILESVEE